MRNEPQESIAHYNRFLRNFRRSRHYQIIFTKNSVESNYIESSRIIFTNTLIFEDNDMSDNSTVEYSEYNDHLLVCMLTDLYEFVEDRLSESDESDCFLLFLNGSRSDGVDNLFVLTD